MFLCGILCSCCIHQLHIQTFAPAINLSCAAMDWHQSLLVAFFFPLDFSFLWLCYFGWNLWCSLLAHVLLQMEEIHVRHSACTAVVVTSVFAVLSQLVTHVQNLRDVSIDPVLFLWVAKSCVVTDLTNSSQDGSYCFCYDYWSFCISLAAGFMCYVQVLLVLCHPQPSDACKLTPKQPSHYRYCWHADFPFLVTIVNISIL